jgi:hypothetical protein
VIRKPIILSVLLLGTSLHGETKRYFVLRGFGMPLVQCELTGDTVRNCKYLTDGPHQLDGVMTAVYRGMKKEVQ